jgi:hypothetical protein
LEILSKLSWHFFNLYNSLFSLDGCIIEKWEGSLLFSLNRLDQKQQGFSPFGKLFLSFAWFWSLLFKQTKWRSLLLLLHVHMYISLTNSLLDLFLSDCVKEKNKDPLHHSILARFGVCEYCGRSSLNSSLSLPLGCLATKRKEWSHLSWVCLW